MNKYEVFYKVQCGTTRHMECPTNNKQEVEELIKQKLKQELEETKIRHDNLFGEYKSLTGKSTFCDMGVHTLTEILSIDPIGVRWKKQNIKKYTQTFTVESYVKVEGMNRCFRQLRKLDKEDMFWYKENIGKITEGKPIVEEVEMKDVPKDCLRQMVLDFDKDLNYSYFRFDAVDDAYPYLKRHEGGE